jgi:hypothetical protein
MTRQLRRPPAGLMTASGARGTVVTEHSLLTSAWTKDVATMEAAIARFGAERPLACGCQVVLFELAGDDQLHVNVIHHRQHPPAALRGWSGPGQLPDGFVYNRRFADAPVAEIIRHIRQMVFA